MKIESLAVVFSMAAVGCMADAPAEDPADVGSSEAASTACAGGGSCAPPSAISDNFVVPTTDGCGRVDFVDFGPGAPGGGDNDDYAVIHDFCGDGHGVIASGTLTKPSTAGPLTFDLGSRYNGNGLAGSAVVWDPFKPLGNVDGGDTIVLEACLVDGRDGRPFRCQVGIWTSADGFRLTQPEPSRH